MERKYMNIREGSIYFVKWLKKQVEPSKKRLLTIEDNKNDTLKMSILEPKVHIPTSFVLVDIVVGMCLQHFLSFTIVGWVLIDINKCNNLKFS